ncbi:MAG: SDR family oxidoreductase [Tannerellaceae bacterium]|nr:SDR family oxidoreductase [Tannerellaceae bacterium]
MKGKRVFITGGANGIGVCLVRTFYDAGALVAFCDIDAEKGKSVCENISPDILFYPVDVSDEKAFSQVINSLINRWGDVDIIINNVGVSNFSPLVETSIQQFDNILSTNLRPVFITSRALAIHRNSEEGKRRYGRIINIASTRYLQSEPGSEGYAASKGGIVALTHALAVSLSEYNITVNCISPGWIQTSGYEKLTVTDHKQHPSGRVGKPEDIASMCLFLCAPENDFMNGQNIVIDGGMTKKMIYEE